MKKKTDLTISILLPDDCNASKLEYSSKGAFKVTDDKGNEIKPEKTERSVHYERNNQKGPKFQTLNSTRNHELTVGGLNELTDLNSFVVIDTNSKVINNTKISAACFSEFRLIEENNAFKIESLFQQYGIYEFHNINGNPEMLAILRLANDISKHRSLQENFKIAFITDSELASHLSISLQKQPIYGSHFLPKGLNLIYASSDTGQELTNKLIRVMDNGAKKYLSKLTKQTLKTSGMHTLEEATSVKYRCTIYPDIKIENPSIKEVTSSSKLDIKFSK